MNTPRFQLLLHVDGYAVASHRRFGSEEAADTAAGHLTNALLPFNDREPEDVVWVEVVDAADLSDAEQASTTLPA